MHPDGENCPTAGISPDWRDRQKEALIMVELAPRPDRYRDTSPDLDSVNGLIQARIDGVISRRELIRRAAMLAVAAPVVGVMLHATSDMAYGAPSQGRDRALLLAAQTASTVPADAPTKPEGEPKAG